MKKYSTDDDPPLDPETEEENRRRLAIGLPPEPQKPVSEINRRKVKFGVADNGDTTWSFCVEIGSRMFTYVGGRVEMEEVARDLNTAADEVRKSISLHTCPFCGGKMMCEPRFFFYPLGIRFRCIECRGMWNYARNESIGENGLFRKRFGVCSREEACRWWDTYAVKLMTDMIKRDKED